MPRSPKKPTTGYDIENGLGFSLHRTSAVLKVAMKTAFREAGHRVTPEEFVLLNLVRDGVDQQLLAGKTGKDKTNVTRLVARLEERGWVARTADPGDRRYQRVELTAEGLEVADALAKVALGRMAEATKGVSQRDLDVTRRTLKKLFDGLR